MNRKLIVMSAGVCVVLGVALFLMRSPAGSGSLGKGEVGLSGKGEEGARGPVLPAVPKSVKTVETVETEGGADTGEGLQASEEPVVLKGGAEVARGGVDKQLLRRQFPDKIDLIPITPKEVAARKKAIQARYATLRKIVGNRASEAEIHAYFNEKEQLTLDRMEIVGFSLNEFGDRMDEDSLERHQTTLMILEKQLERIPERREKALNRLRKARENKGAG